MFALQNVLVLLLVLFSACCVKAQGNLAVNGGFEILVNDNLPPWTFPFGFGGVFGNGSVHAVQGQNYVMFYGLVYQDLATVPGQSYQLAFYTTALNAGTSSVIPVGLNVWWEGHVVQTLSVTWGNWQRNELQVTATTSAARLGFECLNPYGTYPSSLDGVFVMAVPEPRCMLIFVMGLAFAGYRCFTNNTSRTDRR